MIHKIDKSILFGTYRFTDTFASSYVKGSSKSLICVTDLDLNTNHMNTYFEVIDHGISIIRTEDFREAVRVYNEQD